MALRTWIGAAGAVAQRTRVTFSAYTAGVTYRLTVNNKTVEYTAAASTSADVWAGLEAAWNASTTTEHVEAIASTDAGVVLTSRTAGTPFTVTASSSGAPTATVTLLTAATGPNHLMNAANWLGGVAPVAGDELLFTNSAVSVLYDLEQTGINFGDVTVTASYTGSIGLPATNVSGNYPEYRARYLKLGDGTNAYAIDIGQGTGRFSERILIDANAADVTVSIYGSGGALLDSRPVQVKNTGAASSVAIYGGFAGVYADVSGALATLEVIERANSSTRPSIEIGEGVTVTTGTQAGGLLDNSGTITTLTASDGAEINNYGSIPTILLSNRAVCYWLSDANLTTKATVYTGGSLDFSRHASAKTVAAVDLYGGGSLLDPLGVVTWTTGIALPGAKVADVILDVGRARTLSVS